MMNSTQNNNNDNDNDSNDDNNDTKSNSAGVWKGERSNKSNNDHYYDDTTSYYYAVVQCTPAVTDPRELHSILLSSLKSLFGDCYAHNTKELQVLDIVVVNDSSSNSSSKKKIRSSKAILQCPRESFPSVRAALTLSTLPSYMQPDDSYKDNSSDAAAVMMYAFDVETTQTATLAAAKRALHNKT